MAEKRTVITIDPSLLHQREAHMRAKHSGWHVYRAIYWGIYIFAEGLLLLTAVPAKLTLYGFFGWSFVMLSFFVVVYGLVLALHLNLMKKYI